MRVRDRATTNNGEDDDGENDSDEKRTSEYIQKQTRWRRTSRKETKAAVSVLSLAISRWRKDSPQKLLETRKLVSLRYVKKKSQNLKKSFNVFLPTWKQFCNALELSSHTHYTHCSTLVAMTSTKLTIYNCDDHYQPWSTNKGDAWPGHCTNSTYCM